MSKTDSLHYQLCELGGKYLKSRKNAEPWRTPNKYVAVELVAAGAENPDVWATNGYDTTIIEVKTSHADFLADRKKWARTKAAEIADKQIGNFRYYLCPEGIIKEDELPDGWGLLVWDGKKIRKVKSATYAKNSAAMELLIMTSIMSRLIKPQVFKEGGYKMRKPKTPQEIQDQVQRIACAIDDRVQRIEEEHTRLIKRMNRLGEMAENTRNPHALVHPDSVDVLSCIHGWGEIPVFFPNIFELRGYLYKLRKGDKHYGWKPVLCNEDDEESYKERIEELRRQEVQQ